MSNATEQRSVAVSIASSFMAPPVAATSGAAIPTVASFVNRELLDFFEPLGARHRRQAVEEDPAVARACADADRTA